jgi:hypothetical protein
VKTLTDRTLPPRRVLGLLQNAERAAHVNLGEPNREVVQRRRARNKAARKARRANR